MENSTLVPASMFTSTENKGFQMTFENGITISVQFGKGNYCQNKFKDNSQYIHTSKDAEICIWDADYNYYYFGNRIEKGFINTNEVSKYIYICSIVSNIYEIDNKINSI